MQESVNISDTGTRQSFDREETSTDAVPTVLIFACWRSLLSGAFFVTTMSLSYNDSCYSSGPSPLTSQSFRFSFFPFLEIFVCETQARSTYLPNLVIAFNKAHVNCIICMYIAQNIVQTRALSSSSSFFFAFFSASFKSASSRQQYRLHSDVDTDNHHQATKKYPPPRSWHLLNSLDPFCFFLLDFSPASAFEGPRQRDNQKPHEITWCSLVVAIKHDHQYRNCYCKELHEDLAEESDFGTPGLPPTSFISCDSLLRLHLIT